MNLLSTFLYKRKKIAKAGRRREGFGVVLKTREISLLPTANGRKDCLLWFYTIMVPV